jgi:hypothetical protein
VCLDGGWRGLGKRGRHQDSSHARLDVLQQLRSKTKDVCGVFKLHY